MTPWPFMVADSVSACLIFLISRHLGSMPIHQCTVHSQADLKKKGVISPSMAVCMYLCNPLAVLTCSSLSIAGLVQAALMLAVYGAVVQRSPTISGLGLALASYLDIYSIVFCLPVLSIILSGAEVMAEQPCSNCLKQASAPVDVNIKPNRRQCQQFTGALNSADLKEKVTEAPHPLWLTLVQFLAVLLLCASALVLLSDVTVLLWSGGHCMTWLPVDSVGLQGSQESIRHFGNFAWIKKVGHSTDLQSLPLCYFLVTLADTGLLYVGVTSHRIQFRDSSCVLHDCP